jgi:hypothetical protein
MSRPQPKKKKQLQAAKSRTVKIKFLREALDDLNSLGVTADKQPERKNKENK